MTVAKKAKENPLVTGLITIASVAVTSTAVWGGVGLLDELHTTKAELLLYDLKAHTFASNQFGDLSDKLVEIEIIGKCRWLSSEIRALKDAIYVRERDGADPDYINELKMDLADLDRDFTALQCALKMA